MKPIIYLLTLILLVSFAYAVCNGVATGCEALDEIHCYDYFACEYHFYGVGDPRNECVNTACTWLYSYFECDTWGDPGHTCLWTNGMLGEGTLASPYNITNCTQLQNISLDLSFSAGADPYYQLNNSIDCSDTKNWNGGAGFEPIELFNGNLNGRGYTITNLTIERKTTTYAGLFSVIYGEVYNLSFYKVNITGKNYVGAIAGENRGYIDSISVNQGNVNATYYINTLGGLVGYNTQNISNSFVNASIFATSGSTAGGLVGVQAGGLINNTYFYGEIISNGQPGGVGGIVGNFVSGRLFNSFSTGSVSARSSPTDTYAGFIVGVMSPYNPSSNVIANCYWYDGGGTANYGLGGIVPWFGEEITDLNYFKGDVYSRLPTSYWDFNTIWRMTYEFPLLGPYGAQVADKVINTTAENNTVSYDYDFDANILFRRNNTLTWNQTLNVIANQPYKRRFSIQPTSNTSFADVSIAGYYLNDSTATACEINNTAKVVAGNVCQFNFNVTTGTYWPTHYYWDDKLGTQNAITMRQEDMYINATTSFYHRITVDYNYPERAGTAIKLNKGWNLVSLSGFADEGNPVNVSLSKGWNAIGYPSNQTIKMSDILYMNTTGEVLTLEEAASLNYIERTFYYYFANSSAIGSAYVWLSGDDELFENMGFWVYVSASHCAAAPAHCAFLQFPHGPKNDTFFPFSSIRYIYNGNSYTPAEAGAAGLMQTTIYGYSAGYTFYPPLNDMSAWDSFWIYSTVNDLMLTANNENITSDDYIPATVGTFTNSTINFYYDSNIDTGQKLQYYTYSNNLPIWSEISLPSPSNCLVNPVYTRTVANSRVFYVCYDSTNKYVSLKVETSN